MLARFYINGTCVDDLFHILANNGYPVQMYTTDKPNEFAIDVIVKNEFNDKKESEEK